MMYSQSSPALVLSLSLLLLSACATEEKITSSGSTQIQSTPQAIPAKAAAPAYDPVQACLARIPADSTPGTRLLAEGSCRREGAIPSSLLTGDTTNRNRVAVGSVEDSLDACMARIPQDASAGQRMLAAESCKRDQRNQR
jgi:hypothetical protein